MRDTRTYEAFVKAAAASIRDDGSIDAVTAAEITEAGLSVDDIETNATAYLAERGLI
jgi:hypothetical protein